MEHTSPEQRLDQLISGYWISQALYVAARLRLADLLAEGPHTAADLARKTETNGAALYRLLRALASEGIFREEADGRFVLTPLAEPLRAEAPNSKWALIIMMGEEHYRAWGELLHCVHTGEGGFRKLYGKPIFDYLADHPEKARVFDAAMTGIHGREAGPMLDALNFSAVRTLTDIGGGNGSLLAAALERHDHLQGVLFDLPHVIERARPRIEAAGLSARCELVSGNFFSEVPAGADVYLLRHIIHDWDDECAQTILHNCAARLSPKGKVLVVESVIPPGNEPFFGKWLDLTMLVIPEGKERTEAEYRELFAASGLNLSRIVPTSAGVDIIEGVKA